MFTSKEKKIIEDWISIIVEENDDDSVARSYGTLLKKVQSGDKLSKAQTQELSSLIDQGWESVRYASPHLADDYDGILAKLGRGANPMGNRKKASKGPWIGVRHGASAAAVARSRKLGEHLEWQRDHAYRTYEHDGHDRAKARTVVDFFIDKGFELVDIGAGDIVWRKTFTAGKVTAAKIKASDYRFDMRIEVLGRDGELVTNLTQPGTITVERGPGQGLYFMVSDIKLAMDTLEVFGLESLNEESVRNNPEARLLRSSRRLANP